MRYPNAPRDAHASHSGLRRRRIGGDDATGRGEVGNNSEPQARSSVMLVVL